MTSDARFIRDRYLADVRRKQATQPASECAAKLEAVLEGAGSANDTAAGPGGTSDSVVTSASSETTNPAEAS